MSERILEPTAEVIGVCKMLAGELDSILNAVIVNGRVPRKEERLHALLGAMRGIAAGKKYAEPTPPPPALSPADREVGR